MFFPSGFLLRSGFYFFHAAIAGVSLLCFSMSSMAQAPENGAMASQPASVIETPLEISSPQQQSKPGALDVDVDLYFDSTETLTPDLEESGYVDPARQLGSKFIVVEQSHKPSSRKAQLVAAERAVKLGRYEAALELYDQLYQRSPRDAGILLGRAVVLQHLGHTESAILAYEELLDMQPDNLEANINMLGLMGQTYPSVAARHLEDLRQRHPTEVGIVAQLAVIYAAQEQYDEALNSLALAATLEPKNANHIFNMAVITDRVGESKEAIQYYEQALELDTIYGGGRSIPREAVFERLASLR